MPNVELSFVVQQRLFYVFLKDKSPKGTIRIFLPSSEPKFNVIKTRTHSNPSSSICELSRFGNPNVSNVLILNLLLLEFFVNIQEILILRIINTFRYMECNWQHIEYFLLFEIVVFPHSIEHRLLISDKGVGDEVIGDMQGLTALNFGSFLKFKQPGSL